MIAQNQSVIAQVNGNESYVEGSADAPIEPGRGVVWYEDADGEKQVKLAGADANTKRVAREQRNPPRSLGGTGDSPLDDAYAAGDNLETVGFRRHDRARLRHDGNIGTPGNFEDAEVGWDANGYITSSPTTAIGRGIRVIDRDSGDDFVVVEFY
ncbi:hypothetical protein [Haloarcula montana]|uniref:hypothetical protein n=1 Tax=Haloarcula montana TaxID=3111776 RepID=UPI002D78194C|nr:hypothetical protein [Haloarcula sp. GH36]